MATRQTEFSISIEKLEIKFKGTQELGQQIQQGVTHAIGGLMNAQARLLAAPPQPGRVIDAAVMDGAEPQVNGQPSPAVNGEKAKQPRPRRTKGGPSIASLLYGLKQEGYFSQARTSADALVHLKDNKGHSLPESTVRTELQRMVQKADGDPAKLHRSKIEKVYVYKDTPFNEGPRSPSPAEQPAE
jgi:hypothetical protein